MNAKLELLEKLKEISKTKDDVVAVNIKVYEDMYSKTIRVHNKGTYLDLEGLDVDYINICGNSGIDGIVLFNDNTYLERFGYDYSPEWWEYRKAPIIEEVLNAKF